MAAWGNGYPRQPGITAALFTSQGQKRSVKTIFQKKPSYEQIVLITACDTMPIVPLFLFPAGHFGQHVHRVFTLSICLNIKIKTEIESSK